jgi:putative transcriptional regulator
MKKQNSLKRNLFAELMEGVDAMKATREGKITLRTHAVSVPTLKESPDAEFFVAARQKFNVSRTVWANMLRVSPRTVEKWEQGGQVSPLAATFVELVARFPDTIERLQTLPRRISRRSSTGPSPRIAGQAASHKKPGKGTDEGASSLRRAAKSG